jgi:hypothetical protein
VAREADGGVRVSLDLEELERLVNAAEPGPWATSNGPVDGEFWEIHCGAWGNVCLSGLHVYADAAFIAAAREAVPQLIQRVRELEAQKARLVEALGKIEDRDCSNPFDDGRTCADALAACADLDESDVCDPCIAGAALAAARGGAR